MSLGHSDDTLSIRIFSPLPRLSSSLIPFAFLIRQQCGLRLPVVIRGWRDGTSYVLPQVTNWSRRTLSITASDESLSYSKALLYFSFSKVGNVKKSVSKAFKGWTDFYNRLLYNRSFLEKAFCSKVFQNQRPFSLPANNDVIIMGHWVDPHSHYCFVRLVYGSGPTSFLGRFSVLPN